MKDNLLFSCYFLPCLRIRLLLEIHLVQYTIHFINVFVTMMIVTTVKAKEAMQFITTKKNILNKMYNLDKLRK